MTTRTAHAAALVLSVVMSLGIFSSVTRLAAPAHAGALLVQAEGAARS
jgi:hypothetical protein